MISSEQALSNLIAGNQRFTANQTEYKSNIDAPHNTEIIDQEPFAIILGCSDSRVPAEIVFDQGIGDLFVIRVAGNIVASSQIGSVEFAVTQFGTPLVVVLGHSNCGAITATLNALRQTSENPSGNIGSIVNRIRPSVQTLFESHLQNDEDALLRHAIRANIRASVSHLRYGSAILEPYIRSNKLLVVGAEYSLESGEVTFFEGLPTDTNQNHEY